MEAIVDAYGPEEQAFCIIGSGAATSLYKSNGIFLKDK
jgi:hypothetical protein